MNKIHVFKDMNPFLVIQNLGLSFIFHNIHHTVWVHSEHGPKQEILS